MLPKNRTGKRLRSKEKCPTCQRSPSSTCARNAETAAGAIGEAAGGGGSESPAWVISAAGLPDAATINQPLHFAASTCQLPSGPLTKPYFAAVFSFLKIPL